MLIRKSKRLLKKLPEIIAEKLQDRDPEDNRPVLLFAQDEGRCGRISDVRRAWSPLGARPQAPKQVMRTYLYVFTGLGANDLPDLALGQYRDAGHLLKTGGGGFFGLFYPHAGRSGWLARIPEIGST